ncbi:transcriptional regulator [Dictyobacter vulcani]|uniref:Transcriptional regulator n=1 Tax=Dictyobacter vulcani TaxID=2607529 RepID=A0A5J4KFY4_9CHLR|nr:metalloregulator ArsR/SmtB family transcription factor [Dictyobacter vulcani]GER86593.1 transcriptional regulator [Dictyobacter vulcani]
MAAKSVVSPANISAIDEICQERVIHVEHVAAIRHNGLPVDDALRIATLFSVLSDPTRLQVMHALLSSPTGELCVCDLAAGLGRDDTTISHQLRVLRQQKVVTMRKVGRVVYYRLVDEHIRHLLRMGIDHTAEGQISGSAVDREVAQ